VTMKSFKNTLIIYLQTIDSQIFQLSAHPLRGSLFPNLWIRLYEIIRSYLENQALTTNLNQHS